MICVDRVPRETSAKINSHKRFERGETLLLELYGYASVGFFHFKTSWASRPLRLIVSNKTP